MKLDWKSNSDNPNRFTAKYTGLYFEVLYDEECGAWSWAYVSDDDLNQEIAMSTDYAKDAFDNEIERIAYINRRTSTIFEHTADHDSKEEAIHAAENYCNND